MASQGGSSRLAQMQMRFQQKQQQERERRKIEMIGDIVIGKNKISDDISIGNNDTKTTIITTASAAAAKTKTITTTKSNSINNIEKKSLSSSIGAGKVRQMFNERRQRSTGIDKSYPLKPIPTRTNIIASRITTTTTAATSAINSTHKQITTTNLKQTNNNSRANSTSSLQKNDILNGNTNGHEQQDNIDNETFPSDTRFSPDNEVLDGPISSKLPNVGKPIITNKPKNGIIHDDKNNNQNNSNLKLKPVVTKKTPPIINTSSSSINNKNNKQHTTLPLSSSPVNNTKSTTPTITTLSTKTKIESSRTMNINKNPKDEKNTTIKTGNNGLSTCRICNRNFNSDRLEKHEKICEKAANKKRKKYDAVKHRVAGTEVEKYVRKNSKIGGTIKSNTSKLTGTTTKLINSTNTATNTNNNNKENKSSNWRKTHEEFINTIRAAKQMKAHLAKGGKLSDLPPPPPSENLDYIQCPHCSRKFNKGAAERHIPKCANFRHNKPKTGTNAMKRRS